MQSFPPHVLKYPARAAAARPYRMALLAASAAMALVVTVIVLYLAKSALGINLMPGPSPLHAALYSLVR